MSVTMMTRAYEYAERQSLAPASRLVLYVMADVADDDGRLWPGQKRLRRLTGLAVSTIRKALRELEDGGILTTTMRTRDEGRGRTSNLYRLDLQPPGGGVRSSEQPPPPGGGPRRGKSDQPPGDGEPIDRGTTREPSVKNQQQGAVSRLFELWRKETNRDTARLTANRRSRIEARLAEGYAEEMIAEAIRRVARSPFHQGDNDRQRRYDDLELICRNGEKLEEYAELRVPAELPRAAAADLTAARAGLGELEAAWPQVKQRLRRAVPENTYRLWLEPLEPAGFADGVVYLAAPADKREWVQGKYSALLHSVIPAELGAKSLRFVEGAAGGAA